MGRLSAAPARLHAPLPRGTLPREERERERLAERDRSIEWRAWYHGKRWKDLRQQVLTRDLWTCQQTGVLLIGQHPAPNSPVVDHIVPHKGDPALFWNIDNLQAVAKGWHDSVKQAREREGQHASTHPRWLRPSAIPLTIVCGPPCSGKSTYVAAHAGPRDMVIDLDAIAAGISGEPLHRWDRDRWLGPALWRRNDMLGDLSWPIDYRAAWLIVAEASARKRAWWREKLKPIEVIVLAVPDAVCRERAALDPGRDMAATVAAIGQWWAAYRPGRGEIIFEG